MKLSILILTHNRPKLFTRAISSVLDNLPEYDIEILANNDTDDIDEIYDDRVSIQYHYFQHDDLSCVYKYLFDLATGEFIYYLEDDDYIMRNFFSSLDLTVDINFMEYISEPLIEDLGPYHSFKKIAKSRDIDHKNNAKVFLAGPPLVKMATNEDANDEELGGAWMHSSISGVSDFLADDEKHALSITRDLVSKIYENKSKKSEFEKQALQPRFNEDEILAQALTYLESTYAGHYVGELAGKEQNNIQTIDVWQTLGSVDTTCRILLSST